MSRRKQVKDIEDTFNVKFGNSFKLMTRRMLQDAVGDTTIVEITCQKDWEAFLLSD